MRTRLPLLAALIALAALLATPPSRAQTGEDARWSDAFGIPGVQSYNPNGSIDGYARVLAVASNGDVYVGGYFPVAGGIAANHVARWDGRTWHALGDGITATTFEFAIDYFWATPVQAIAAAPSGEVYVGGQFSAVDGAPAANVARWNGSAWSPLGVGLPGMVTALTVGPDGAVYAGYGSTIATGQGSPRVARWDGAAWTVMAEANGDVRALLFGPDGALYVGGEFQTIGGTTSPYLARWSGSAWSPVGAGITGCSAPRCGVFALTSYDGQLYIGGEFNQVGARRADRVARWTGSEWFGFNDGLSFGAPRRVEGLAVDAGGVYTAMMEYYAGFQTPCAEGSPYGDGDGGGPRLLCDADVGLAHWNGSEWVDLSPLPDPDPINPQHRYVGSGLFTVALRGDEVLVGGGNVVGIGASGRYLRSAGEWRPLGGDRANGLFQSIAGGAAGIYDVVTGTDGTVYVGGIVQFAGDLPTRNVAAWDGSQWYDIGSGLDSRTQVTALGIAANGEIYAADYIATTGGSRIMIWNGTTWRSSGSTNDYVLDIEFGQNDEAYVALRSPIVYDEDGDEKNIGSGVARLENGEWTEVGDLSQPLSRYGMEDLEVGPDGRIYVTWEYFEQAGVAMWDGSTWTTLADEFTALTGPGTSEGVQLHALSLAPNGDLYLGGQFGRVEGHPANSLARWDGTQWSRVGSGFALDVGSGPHPGQVGSLAFLNGKLFVGGTFNRVYQPDGSVVQATSIVRWEGAQFEALGRGLPNFSPPVVNALATYGNNLYVAGFGVTNAGPYTSFGIARYYDGDLPPVSTEDEGQPAGFALDAPFPNPARGGAIRLRYGLPAAEGVRLDVYDVLGRRIAVLAEGEAAAGWHEAVLETASLASGIYVVRLHAGVRVLTRRVTVVR